MTGEKDVENRTWPLTPESFPAYVLIASSKAPPTRKDLREYHRRLQLQGSERTNGEEFHFQHILGLVKVRGCYDESSLPWPSVWYNSGDIGWFIEDAWKFECPIPLRADDRMQTQVSLAKRPEYVDAIATELREL